MEWFLEAAARGISKRFYARAIRNIGVEIMCILHVPLHGDVWYICSSTDGGVQMSTVPSGPERPCPD